MNLFFTFCPTEQFVFLSPGHLWASSFSLGWPFQFALLIEVPPKDLASSLKSVSSDLQCASVFPSSELPTNPHGTSFSNYFSPVHLNDYVCVFFCFFSFQGCIPNLLVDNYDFCLIFSFYVPPTPTPPGNYSTHSWCPGNIHLIWLNLILILVNFLFHLFFC